MRGFVVKVRNGFLRLSAARAEEKTLIRRRGKGETAAVSAREQLSGSAIRKEIVPAHINGCRTPLPPAKSVECTKYTYP